MNRILWYAPTAEFAPPPRMERDEENLDDDVARAKLSSELEYTLNNNDNKILHIIIHQMCYTCIVEQKPEDTPPACVA